MSRQGPRMALGGLLREPSPHRRRARHVRLALWALGSKVSAMFNECLEERSAAHENHCRTNTCSCLPFDRFYRQLGALCNGMKPQSAEYLASTIFAFDATDIDPRLFIGAVASIISCPPSPAANVIRHQSSSTQISKFSTR